MRVERQGPRASRKGAGIESAQHSSGHRRNSGGRSPTIARGCGERKLGALKDFFERNIFASRSRVPRFLRVVCKRLGDGSERASL